MTEATALNTLDRARRSAMALSYRTVRGLGGFFLQEEADAFTWASIAWFKRREDLEAFLTAQLSPPRDHTPSPDRR